MGPFEGAVDILMMDISSKLRTLKDMFSALWTTTSTNLT
jgi:hypothetical protein